MYNNKPLSSLTNSEISKALKELNLNVGPVTSSTRKIYERRLCDHYKQQSAKTDNTDNGVGDIFGEKSQERPLVTNGQNIESTSSSKENHSIKSLGNQNSTTCLPNGVTPQTLENDIEKSAMGNGVTNNENSSSAVTASENGLYYGVWCPGNMKSDKQQPYVFSSRKDALLAMKAHRDSRFKSFTDYSEAEQFSLKNDKTYVDKIIALVASNSKSSVENKPPSFKSPSFQELLQFRRYLEQEKTTEIRACLRNPKYMITSSDIPVILHEGSRQNALHIAIRSNRPVVCRMLIAQLRSDDFLRLMYPGVSASALQFRRRHLLDLYLNTPDKICCDTVLHTACKFGYVEIARYLLSMDEVNKSKLNKANETPQQVIGMRIDDQVKMINICKEIQFLFEEKAFVPLYNKNEERTTEVGRPLSVVCPPDTVQPPVEKVKAYFGPVTPEKANELYNILLCAQRKSPIPKTDFEKGLERLGREVATKENVPFAEHWSFLNGFYNLTTKEGLEKLELYLKTKNEKANVNKTLSQRTTNHSNNNSFDKIESHDEIKRKLSFDDDVLSKTNSDKSDNNADDNSQYCVDINYKDFCVSFKKICALDSPNSSRDSFQSLDDETNGTQNETPDLTNEKHDETSENIDNTFEDDDLLEDSCEQNEVESVPDDLLTLRDPESPEPGFHLISSTTPHVFINGDCPSKIDVDVLRAIDGVVIEPLMYPHIQVWKRLVHSFPTNHQVSWPSPSSPRYKKLRNRTSHLWTC